MEFNSYYPFTTSGKYGAITLTELLAYGGHMVTYKPRYCAGTDIRIGVMISGDITCLAQMADAMTDGGDYCQHVENMLYGTPYFPHGEGHTFEEAIANAMAKVNRHTRAQFQHAWPLVLGAAYAYPAVREAYKPWEPLDPAPWVEGLAEDARNAEAQARAKKEEADYVAVFGQRVPAEPLTYTVSYGPEMHAFLKGWVQGMVDNIPDPRAGLRAPVSHERYKDQAWMVSLAVTLKQAGVNETMVTILIDRHRDHLATTAGAQVLNPRLGELEAQKCAVLQAENVALLLDGPTKLMWLPAIPQYFNQVVTVDITGCFARVEQALA